VNSAGLKLHSHRIPCQVATGNFEDASITKPVDVICCGTITKMELLVFDRPDGLLGKEWLDANHAYVCTFASKLVFQDKTFSLLHNDDGDHPLAFPMASIVIPEELDTLVITAHDLAELESEIEHEPWPLSSSLRSDSDFEVVYNENMAKVDLLQLNNFICKHKDIFARDVNDIKEHCNIIIIFTKFSFTIIHRAGRLHGNADALSRIISYIDQVNVVDLVNAQSNFGLFDDFSMKSIDVWENDKLLFFLEHGKHLAGTTNQQVKYIARKALHYVLEISQAADNTLTRTLYYFKDKSNFSTRRIVPKPFERQVIIHDAHHLGHYGLDKTASDICSKFYWRNVWQQVEFSSIVV